MILGAYCTVLQIYFAEEATIGDVLGIFDHFSTPAHLGLVFKLEESFRRTNPRQRCTRLIFGALGPSMVPFSLGVSIEFLRGYMCR